MFKSVLAPSRWYLAIAAALIFPPLVACEPPGMSDLEPVDACRVSEGSVDLGGSWTLRGSGSRSGCRDDSYDGKFTLGTSVALRVVQDDENGSDAENIALAQPILFPGGSFDLNGSVSGICVDFSSIENGPQGEIVYRFSGTAADMGVIRGSFTGDGPRGCTTSGTFSASVR